MTDQQPDMRCDALLRRALVPKGYRPTKDADIEKMLDMIDDLPMSEDKKLRMLRKINGEEVLFPERAEPPPVANTEFSESERQLVTLHRAQNRPLPVDLAAKVKAMEERAAQGFQGGKESASG